MGMEEVRRGAAGIVYCCWYPQSFPVVVSFSRCPGGLPSPKWWCTVLVSRSLILPYSRLLLVLGVISDVIVKGPSVGYSFLFIIVFVFINLVFA